MVDSERRVAVVTGGSRGIGRGIVRALARAGFDVVVNYRADETSAREAVDEAQRQGSRRAWAMRADVSDLHEGRSLVEWVATQCGRIDIWIHNAGVAPEQRRDILETTPDSWDRVLGINLRGPYLLTQHVARAMIEQRARLGDVDPQIHFITSVSSVMASTNRGEYCVSKAGLSMVAQLFAVRLAEYGIRVFEIRPGIIETDMTARVRSAYDARFAAGLAPINRWGKPDDVGTAVAAIAQGQIPYATGNVIYIDGGLHISSL